MSSEVVKNIVWSLEQARKQTFSLVEDLNDEQICQRSTAGENPPIWILGHLLLGDIYLLSMLNNQELSADFINLLSKYGPNSNQTSNIENYDSKKNLVQRLTETNFQRLEAISKMKNTEQPTPDENLAQTQPTIGHHLQMLVFHEGHHCGQISSWRKLQGLSAVKGIFAS